MDLPRGCADRAMYGIVISLMLVLTLGGLIGVMFEWKPHGIGEQIGKIAAVEFLILFNVMLILTLLWCLFTPAWVERALQHKEKWFKVAVTLVIVGGIATLVILSAQRH